MVILGIRSEDVRWLALALGDVGFPVAGWSGAGAPGYSRDGRFSLRAESAGDVVEAIASLWENERPGYSLGKVHCA